MWKKIVLGIIAVLVVAVVGLFGYVQISWDKKWEVPLPALKTSTDPAVIAEGRYLVRGAAHCSICHMANREEMARSGKGENLPLRDGATLKLGPVGTMRSANLTPDPETGIDRYSDGHIFRMMRHAVKPDGTASIALMMPF